MYHSITIGRKNTWNDWHLIPESRPYIAPPTVKTNYVDIPGGHGSLDLSTALTGEPIYNDRTGSWTFIVENGHKEWHELYSEIMNTIHGQYLTVVLEDDPSFYYIGRITVSSWSSDQHYSKIGISYQFQPFKYLVNKAMKTWLWDTFDLENDSISGMDDYTDISVQENKTVNITGLPITCMPVITSSVGGMTVQKGTTTVTLSQGKNNVSEIEITTGTNSLIFSGTGTISIDFDGRSL